MNQYINRLINGDCLEVMRNMPSNAVHGLIADPPYSSGGMFRSDRALSPHSKYQNSNTATEYANFEGDNKDQRSYLFWSVLWLSQGFRLVKDGGVACVFSDWRQLPITTDILQAAGFIWRGIAVWDKTEGARPRKGCFRSQCEFVVWGSKGPIANEGPCLPGVWRKAINASEKFHLTGKPLSIMRKVCQIVPPGGIVLDPFAGSGSTLIAASQIGRKFIGIEINPEYCRIAGERLKGESTQLTFLNASFQAEMACQQE